MTSARDVLSAAGMLVLLVGSCSAHRALHDVDVDEGQCGVFLEDLDFEANTIEWIPDTSKEDCVEICKDFAGCTAIASNPFNDCVLKDVDSETFATEDEGRYVYRLCPEEIGGGGDELKMGQWGPVIDMPLVPAASALLPNGNILVWSGTQVDDFLEGNAGETFYTIFSPWDNAASSLETINVGHDMFCPGITHLSNGAIMVVGGSFGGDGANASSIFSGGGFSEGPDLNTPRGYNSAVTLASGAVFTLGGSFSGVPGQDKGGEVWSPSANFWRATTAINGAQILSDDPQGEFRTDNYGFFFAWTMNSVFHAGPSTNMNWFTGLSGQGTVTPAGYRGPTAMNGNAVMYAAGKILVVGGAASFSMGDEARPGAELISLGPAGFTPNVDVIAGPNNPRTYAMSVVLPNGEVALIGGAKLALEFTDATAVFEVEIWNPDTQTWRTDASADSPRAYHSSAVLVHDGRVFVGGGGLCGGCSANHLDVEMYSPPYLFNDDGSPAERPSIWLSTQSVDPGDGVFVYATEQLSMVSMIRMGASSHSINTDQRRLELCGPNSYPCSSFFPYVQVPGYGVAPPGYWMVFGINEAGTPSMGVNLQVF